MSDLPDHSEFNDPTTGERLRRLKHLLDRDDLVDEVLLYPGGAVDAATIKLSQYTGTVPERIVEQILDLDLAIRSVGGYMSVDVSRPERYGGDLDESQEVRA